MDAAPLRTRQVMGLAVQTQRVQDKGLCLALANPQEDPAHVIMAACLLLPAVLVVVGLARAVKGLVVLVLRASLQVAAVVVQEQEQELQAAA